MRVLSAILLLAICSPCWGQSYVQSDLIDGPKAVAVGELFKVKIQGDLPYKLDPEPVSIDELLDRKGNLLLLVVVGEPGELKISVDYRVVHPTDEEIEKAPWDDREKFKAWLKSQAGRDDELYHDLHTVKVGDGKPDPDDDDPIPASFESLTKAVAVLAKDRPAAERTLLKTIYEAKAGESHASIKERVDATAKAIETGLGLNAYDEWYDFRLGLAKELSKLKQAGTLTETNHDKCWLAIAEGLK